MEKKNQYQVSETEDVGLVKCPTGIHGLDIATLGGIPRDRTTLVAGGTGCGKTFFGVQFLIGGALDFGEPGVLIAFEERPHEIKKNFTAIGWDLDQMISDKQLLIDYVETDRSQLMETGEYDLEGLFVRLDSAINEIGAKRVVIDTIETLFAGINEAALIRAELRRLFQWLSSRGVTTILTSEKGNGTLSRRGLEEYVSDCVILLDNRVSSELTTRRLRVVKYRGSQHELNEYPFIIGKQGMSVMPLTSIGLDHAVSQERIATGINELDAMLGGGIYRGSSVLINGTAGTGKTTLGCTFAQTACERNERTSVFLFEESPDQIVRNMNSIGLDMTKWRERGLLRVRAYRPSSYSPEHLLVNIMDEIQVFQPHMVVIDPMTNLTRLDSEDHLWSFMIRLVDYLKSNDVTGVFTDLSKGNVDDMTKACISSVMDTWIRLRSADVPGERNHILSVIKSRGTAHSNQDREFHITSKGIELTDIYVGSEGVLTGSARASQEAREKAAELLREQEIDRLRCELENSRGSHNAQVQAINAEFQSKCQELQLMIKKVEMQQTLCEDERNHMERVRGNPAQFEKTESREQARSLVDN